jgi:hypothetical protein
MVNSAMAEGGIRAMGIVDAGTNSLVMKPNEIVRLVLLKYTQYLLGQDKSKTKEEEDILLQ